MAHYSTMLSVLTVLALMMMTVQSASGPGGHQRNSKMKPPPIISEETSNKNRRTSGKIIHIHFLAYNYIVKLRAKRFSTFFSKIIGLKYRQFNQIVITTTVVERQSQSLGAVLDKQLYSRHTHTQQRRRRFHYIIQNTQIITSIYVERDNNQEI